MIKAKQFLSPEIEYILQLGYYDAMREFALFTAQRSKCPTQIQEMNPERSHTSRLTERRLVVSPLKPWQKHVLGR